MKGKLILVCSLLFTSITYGQSLSIDFSSADTVKSMSGFVHGMDDTYPVDSLITPLKPAYWRGGVYLNANGLAPFYLRATGFNTKYILVLGDIWGYPGDWTQSPDADTSAFKNFVDTICSSTSGYPMIYDIWGEPNGAGWSGTQLQFFDVFKLAHDRIRFNLGNNVEVSGPSIWWADTTYLRNFCDYCLAKNIQLDVLSFHWFTDDIFTDLLDDALLWCRTTLMDNPTYAPLQIKKIMVNEVVAEDGHYAPGFMLAHYYYLEKGKADGACRSCWNNCWDNTLEGLLSPATNQRLPQWWATKVYADMDSLRFPITSSNPRVYAFAGNLLANPNIVRGIVGYYQNTTSLSNINISISLNNLNQLSSFPSTDSIELKVYKIPNEGDIPLAQPIPIGIYSFANNLASISLPSLQLDTNSILYFDIISTGTSIGIGENYSPENISIFPNPANDYVNVQLNTVENVRMEIQDIHGKIISSYLLKPGVNQIDVSTLSNGVYMIAIKGKLKKILITH